MPARRPTRPATAGRASAILFRFSQALRYVYITPQQRIWAPGQPQGNSRLRASSGQRAGARRLCKTTSTMRRLRVSSDMPRARPAVSAWCSAPSDRCCCPAQAAAPPSMAQRLQLAACIALAVLAGVLPCRRRLPLLPPTASLAAACVRCGVLGVYQPSNIAWGAKYMQESVASAEPLPRCAMPPRAPTALPSPATLAHCRRPGGGADFPQCALLEHQASAAHQRRHALPHLLERPLLLLV